MDGLRRLARKSRMERIKNEHIKKIMGVKGKLDIIHIIEKKRLQWYGHVKRMPEKRRKRGRPRKMWMEGIQAAMTTRNLEPDQWRNREEWCLVSRRWRQLL
jgi:CTP synthase (UTP-ammonia lyase)